MAISGLSLEERAMTRQRLLPDDFIALRSMARMRWYQGHTIGWKFNSGWRSVRYDEVEALDAADRLIEFGLVEEGTCCQHCRRATIQLTTRGEEFVRRMNAKKSVSASLPSAVTPARHGWLARLRAAMVKKKISKS